MTDVTGEPPTRQPAELVGASEEPVQLSGIPVDVPVTIDQRAAETALSTAGLKQPNHVYLTVQEVEGEEDPGTVYGIYVNLPDDQTDPNTVAAHYAGAISFFGIARAAAPRTDEPPHTVAVTHEITALTHELESQGQWDGEHVTVTFRPTGLVPPDHPEMAHVLPAGLTSDDPPITIGRVSIFYG
jgi:tyrosinase